MKNVEPAAKLVLFDGNAIMHRAYHALPPLTTKDDEPIGAVYGLVSMLLKVISDLEPTHIAFAFDRPEPTFRKKLDENYQAHRPEMESELAGQFEKARDMLEAFGIPVYSKAGYEADDVIGTIAASVVGRQSSDVSVTIVTGDHDMLQLVDEKKRVHLYMPLRGLSEGKEFGEKETLERLGVGPRQLVDFKALVGDPSDNYKGIPGIGPKTAAGLLQRYIALKQIYKSLDKLPRRTRKLLEEHKESAFQSQKLARIVTDVDVGFDFEKAGMWSIGNKKTLALFETYGFKTLSERVKKMNQQTLL